MTDALSAAQKAAELARDAAAKAQAEAAEKELAFFNSCKTLSDLKAQTKTDAEASRLCSRFISRCGYQRFAELVAANRPRKL